jgi:hypothetical protein
MGKSFGKSVFVGISILAVCAIFLALQPAPKKFRVGTFDSRAIAIAYASSDLNAQYLTSLRAKYEKAKAEKNEKVIKECEAEGKAQQQVLHQQGFSIASVADILDNFKAEMPKILKEADVAVIVSKWEVISKGPDVETVDITSSLVKLFNPSEKARKWIEGLPPQPMSLKELLILLPEEGKEKK